MSLSIIGNEKSSGFFISDDGKRNEFHRKNPYSFPREVIFPFSFPREVFFLTFSGRVLLEMGGNGRGTYRNMTGA